MNIRFPLLYLLFLSSPFLSAQVAYDRFEELSDDLATYAISNPKVDKRIDISVTGTIQEFALAFSRETKLNLTVSPSIGDKIVTNFSETRPRDILLHLCRFYDLDLTFSGSILGLIPFNAPEEKAPIKAIGVTYNDYSKTLKLDLNRDTLDQVLREVSAQSGINVIASPDASTKIISGFVGASPFEQALNQLAVRNGLKLNSKKEEGYYLLEIFEAVNTEKKEVTNESKRKKSGQSSRNLRNSREGFLSIKASEEEGKYDLIADQVSLGDLIEGFAEKTGDGYFLFDKLKDPVTIKLEGVGFEQVLTDVMSGTAYAFKKQNDVYLIGNNNKEGVLESRVVQLQHRSVKKLTEFIPKDLTSEVSISEFLQLNALILSGPASAMDRLTHFIKEIDRSVPVIMIELMIIDVQNSKEIRAGLEAGIASQPVPSGGRVFPDFNFTFSSGAINELLSTLSGNGIVNLGQVKPNFYASLHAVEDNGMVKVRSKPRLSTLNGIEANLSLGETRYYLNERTTLQGNQNPISLQDRRFEAVNADFSIRIVPVVSGDEYVTLEIEVNQSDFIGQVQNNAPPPQVNRTFNSNIRILNQEMIVLGGLENKSLEESGTGVPLLSRIPILKWLFSSRKRGNSRSKLLVFVRPTVIY